MVVCIFGCQGLELIFHIYTTNRCKLTELSSVTNSNSESRKLILWNRIIFNDVGYWKTMSNPTHKHWHTHTLHFASTHPKMPAEPNSCTPFSTSNDILYNHHNFSSLEYKSNATGMLVSHRLLFSRLCSNQICVEKFCW